MTYIILALFSIMYALKGGQGAAIFNNWNKIRERNWFYRRGMDGKILSTLLAFIFALVATSEFLTINMENFYEYSFDVLSPFLFAGAWLLSVAPSMGEEYGSLIRAGEYINATVEKNGLSKPAFGKYYGHKKCIQRGVWIGAIMAIATGFIPYIYFSFAFMPLAWISLNLGKKTGNVSFGWMISEFLIGAVVYGIPTVMWVSG